MAAKQKPKNPRTTKIPRSGQAIVNGNTHFSFSQDGVLTIHHGPLNTAMTDWLNGQGVDVGAQINLLWTAADSVGNGGCGGPGQTGNSMCVCDSACP